jgi:hypothetical protein
MLGFGPAAPTRPPVPRYEDNVVHENSYRRMTDDELAQFAAGLEAQGSSSALPTGVANIGQLYYKRKHAVDFMVEMNRSVEWWLERWSSTQASD